MIVCRVHGENIQQNASYGIGFTINRLDNSGEWAINQYDMFTTFYACAASSVFVQLLEAGDVLRWQCIADPTRKVEYFGMWVFHISD